MEKIDGVRRLDGHCRLGSEASAECFEGNAGSGGTGARGIGLHGNESDQAALVVLGLEREEWIRFGTGLGRVKLHIGFRTVLF